MNTTIPNDVQEVGVHMLQGVLCNGVVVDAHNNVLVRQVCDVVAGVCLIASVKKASVPFVGDAIGDKFREGAHRGGDFV